MKTAFTPLLILLTVAGAHEAVDFDKINPGTHSDVPYIRQEGPLDNSRLTPYLQARLRILSSVQDWPGASEAVEKLRVLNTSVLPPASEDCPPVNVLQMGIAAEINRLRDAFFYGDAALAELLNFSAADARVPSPLTDDILAELKVEIERNLAALPPKQRSMIEGGPGFSRDGAWIIKASSSEEGYHASFLMAGEMFDDWDVFSYRTEIVGERRYLVCSVTLERKGKLLQVEQWCDITAAHKVYTPEEQEKAMEQIVANLTEMQHLMLTISDRKSADEAAVRMMGLIRDVTPLREIAQTSNTETLLMNNLTPSFDYVAFRKAILRHHENDCYGSEKLRDFIRMLHGSQEE